MRSLLWSYVLLVILVLFLVLLISPYPPQPGEWLSSLRNYLIVFAIGAIVGFIDAGDGALTSLRQLSQNKWFLFYLFINGILSVIALKLIFIFGWEFISSDNELAVLTTQILIAGAGTSILFRSSFFTVNVGDQKTPIGLNLIMEKLLNIVAHEMNQNQAKVVTDNVYCAVKDLNYEEAAKALPVICAGLKSIEDNEATELYTQIEDLTVTDLDKQTKLISLGLLLNKYFGFSVLKSAIRSWSGEGIDCANVNPVRTAGKGSSRASDAEDNGT